MHHRAKLLLSVVLVGCASNVDEGGAIESISNLISFSPMYSAFDDGKHEYAVTPNIPSTASSKDEDPVLAASINWELDDSFVKREEFPDLPAAIKLTTKKVGVTNIALTAKTLSGRAIRSETKLTIHRAEEWEWDAGESRYNNGQKAPWMRPPIVDADGKPCPMDIVIEVPQASACGNCHAATSMVAIEPTPTQTARYSDEDLIKIFTRGEKPADGYKSAYLRAAPFPDCQYKDLHTWTMPDDERNGIVWKLRSIPPRVADTNQ